MGLVGYLPPARTIEFILTYFSSESQGKRRIVAHKIFCLYYNRKNMDKKRVFSGSHARGKSLFDWKNLRRVLVCIDAANLENSVKDLGWWVDYRRLWTVFKRNTRLVEIRHYCVRFGNKRHDSFLTFLKKVGIKLITKPLKIIKEEDILKGDIRKANFDVEIATDALELADSYDTLILFSGDSDFEYLLKFLKSKKGRSVVVVSTKHHVSRELISSCDFYLDLKKLKKFLKREGK